MKIALIGATGYVGSAILNEALQRGHLVTAIARNPQQIPATEGVSIQTADVFDSKSLSDILYGHDVLVSAFSVFKSENDPKLAFKNQLKAYDNIIKSAKEAKLKRLMIVGGAGALKLPSGTDLVDSPTFPAEWKEMALSMREIYRKLLNQDNLNWAFFSPAAKLLPGPKTGKFRLGSDQLLTDNNGESKISVGDYSSALVDELENPKINNQIFTIAY